MSAPKRKMDTASSSESSEDEDSKLEGEEEVQIEFEGRAPYDPDSYGITQLLSRLFLKAQINISQIAEVIIGQNFVGSVISQVDSDMSDDEDQDGAGDDMCEEGTIFGVTTVFNMTSKKHLTCMNQLKTYILERAKKSAPAAVAKRFTEVLQSTTNHVGFLVNERFINIPAPVSVPLLENLVKEIEKAKKKGMPYNFKYLVMIVKFYRKEADEDKPAEDQFTNAEEELICTKALSSFEFSVADETDTAISGKWSSKDEALTPYRKVLLLDAGLLEALVDEIPLFIK